MMTDPETIYHYSIELQKYQESHAELLELLKQSWSALGDSNCADWLDQARVDGAIANAEKLERLKEALPILNRFWETPHVVRKDIETEIATAENLK